jgi:hypothetical protein
MALNLLPNCRDGSLATAAECSVNLHFGPEPSAFAVGKSREPCKAEQPWQYG